MMPPTRLSGFIAMAPSLRIAVVMVFRFSPFHGHLCTKKLPLATASSAWAFLSGSPSGRYRLAARPQKSEWHFLGTTASVSPTNRRLYSEELLRPWPRFWCL